VGVDTRLDGPPPHYFRVVLSVPPEALEEDVGDYIKRHRLLLEAIVDAEKPAHTMYNLDVEAPDLMQVGVRSTVGVNTMIG
jgi:hypothetical protein